MARTKKNALTNTEQVIEAPPEGIQDTMDLNDAQLSELKQMAKNAPAAPSARPGRFSLRRPDAIHTLDNSGRVENPETTAKKQASINLLQSYIHKRVLTGTVIGVNSQHTRNAKNKMLYYVIVCNGPFQVFIPADKFAATDIADLHRSLLATDPNKTMDDATKIYLESRLGAEIDYVVSEMSDDMDATMIVGGNRVEAMRRARIRFWFGTTTDGRYLLNVGDKAQARIIAVARNGIRIEIFGVETFIRPNELKWSMIQDAREEYQVGQRITVLLTDITRDEDNDYNVVFSASVKKAEPDPRTHGLRVFSDGGIYTGTINYIRIPTPDAPNIRPAVFVKLDEGVQCMCPFPHGSVPPKQNAKVYVRITSHDDERKFIFGKITHICPT